MAGYSRHCLEAQSQTDLVRIPGPPLQLEDFWRGEVASFSLPRSTSPFPPLATHALLSLSFLDCTKKAKVTPSLLKNYQWLPIVLRINLKDSQSFKTWVFPSPMPYLLLAQIPIACSSHFLTFACAASSLGIFSPIWYIFFKKKAEWPWASHFTCFVFSFHN